jgi:hypothetical protein
MARIPMGNFEMPSVQAPVRTGAPDNSGAMAGARALQEASNVGMSVGEGFLSQAVEQQAKERREAESLARVDMVNASSEYEIQVSAAQDRFDKDMQAGKIDFRNAEHEWGNRVGQLKPPPLPVGADQVLSAQFNGALKQTDLKARLKVQGFALSAKQAHIEASAADTLSKNVMVAGMPGGNTEEAIARNQALLPLLRGAGYDETKSQELIRKADQAIYSNEAKGRIEGTADDAQGLNAVLHDLTAEGGRYVSKLADPSQRLALASTVRSRLQQLENQTQQEADKRLEAAKRTVASVWDQATAAVRPTPDTLMGWQATVAGTPYQQEFESAVQSLQEVYGVLRQPASDQAAYVQGLRTQLASTGGTPADQARIDKIESVIDKSNQQRDSDPLLWLANMTGKPVEPINFQAAFDGDLSSLGTTVQSRMDSLTALRGRFGPSVAAHPLLPQESKALVSAMKVLTPDRLTPLFGLLRVQLGSDATFDAVMQQVAPDAPLKAYAGQIAVRPGGEKAASLILRGEALLNPPDGTQKWPMPSDAKFAAAFLDTAGNAYQGRPEVLQQDLAAARAVYAAAAAQDGATEAGKEFDPARFSSAMRAVIGDLAQVGPTRVTAPWGVPADQFERRATTLASDALRAAGLDAGAAGIGLMATSRRGRYMLVQGRTPVWNPNVDLVGGRLMPVFIDWTPMPAEPKASSNEDARARLDPAAQATLRGTR